MQDLKDSKPVRRKVLVNIDNRLEPRASDYCTVTLLPSGIISFRPYRSRREIGISLSQVYKIAMARDVAENKPKRMKHKVSRGLLALEK